MTLTAWVSGYGPRTFRFGRKPKTVMAPMTFSVGRSREGAKAATYSLSSTLDLRENEDTLDVRFELTRTEAKYVVEELTKMLKEPADEL